MEKILQINNMWKTFGGTTALADVDFDLYPGEVHALVGENGAGKSTLIKIITGIHQPDRGEILLKGKSVHFPDARASYAQRIAAIYQEASLFPDLSVAENIYMGHHSINPYVKTIRWGDIKRKAAEIIKQLEVKLNPNSLVKTLGIAEKQLVEIVKALSVNAEILIMDEPTSALTIEEVGDLFKIVRNLKENGTAIIFISHRIQEIFEIADRVTVLRDGKVVSTNNVNEITEPELVKDMVGRSLENYFHRDKIKPGKTVLKVENLYRAGEFNNISFELREGEIVGFAGLVGAGRTEVARAIFGAEKIEGGKIFVYGKEVKIRNPKDALNLGIAYLSESRGEYGLVLGFSITRNITLPILNKVQKYSFINNTQEKEIAIKYFKLLDIRARGIDQEVGSLSGGNQQKVSVAKCLAANARILFLDEPTRGVDVGTKAAIHILMNELTKEGIAILMISSELPEVLGMSDRIIVMHEGIIKTEFDIKDATQEKILAVAVGK